MVSLFSKASERSIALIGRGCFGGGLLKASLTEIELKAMTDKWPRILEYRRIAEQHGRSILDLALQFSRSAKPISVHLLGMRTEAHLHENLKHMAAPPFTADELDEVTKCSRSAGSFA